MEKRVSYIVLGTFVIVLGVSLISFLFWLAKYGDKKTENDYYKSYFNESVSGLSVESPVKLRGVEVGRVKKISIDKNDSQKVEVILEIKKDTPIKKDSFAMLDTQGITGLKYIEIKGGTKNSPRLITSKKQMAVIETKKSMMSAIFDSGESITNKLDKILDRVYIVLSKQNIKNFSLISEHLSSTARYIDNNKERFTDVLNQFEEIKRDIQNSLKKVTTSMLELSKKTDNFLEHTKGVEDKILPSFEKLAVMSDKAASASEATRKFFETLNSKAEKGQFDMSDIVEENLQILNETALSIKELSLKIEQSVNELSKSPSDILYKSRRQIPGPGEQNEDR